MSREVYGLMKLRETWVVAEPIRRTMQANRSTGTGPEEAFRHALWQAGLRGYRKNVKGLPGKPDVVFGKARLAIFVHGCYWHQCPHCQRNRTPKTNAAYWSAKFEANQERDGRNEAALEELGYRVLVVWECEVRRGLDEQVERVRGMLDCLENGNRNPEVGHREISS